MHPHVQLSRVYLVSTLVSTLDVTHLIKRKRGYKNYDILHNQNSTKHNQVIQVQSNQSLISQLAIIGQDSTALAVYQILIFILLFYMKSLMQQPRMHIQDSTWLHMQYQVSFISLYHDYAYCQKLECASITPIPCLPKSSQASTLCVVSGFLLVKVCALGHRLQWTCLMLCCGQDEMACHLHPILCTWDVVITRTPVTFFFFHLGCGCVQKNK